MDSGCNVGSYIFDTVRIYLNIVFSYTSSVASSEQVYHTSERFQYYTIEYILYTIVGTLMLSIVYDGCQC